MYHDSVQLVWEGNSVQGREKVERFLQVIAFFFIFCAISVSNVPGCKEFALDTGIEAMTFFYKTS